MDIYKYRGRRVQFKNIGLKVRENIFNFFFEVLKIWKLLSKAPLQYLFLFFLFYFFQIFNKFQTYYIIK